MAFSAKGVGSGRRVEEEFYVGVGGKRSEMRVDEEYGQRKGWDEESESVYDDLGVKSGVIVGVGEWRVPLGWGACYWRVLTH